MERIIKRIYKNKLIIMNTKTITTFLCLMLLISSCKKDKKQKNDSKIVQEKFEKFTLKAKLITDKKDRFQIVFKNIDNETQLYKIDVKEVDTVQTIEATYKFKYDFEYPTLVYLGLGYTKEKEVDILSVEIEYDGKKHIFNPKDYRANFIMNKFVDTTNVKGKFITKKIGKEHVPIISIKRKAIDFIK